MFGSTPWGLWCGVAGMLGAAIWVAADAVEGRRAKQFDTLLYGVVDEAPRPALFRLVLVGRWVAAPTFTVAGVVLGALGAILN